MIATATAPRTEAALALHDGAPVRGPDNPLPQRAPRIIYGLVKQVLDSGFTADFISQFEQEFAALRYGVAQSNCTGRFNAPTDGAAHCQFVLGFATLLQKGQTK